MRWPTAGGRGLAQGVRVHDEIETADGNQTSVARGSPVEPGPRPLKNPAERLRSTEVRRFPIS